MYRRLVASNPDAFEPNLAASLINLGAHRPGYQKDTALAGGGFLLILPGGPVVIAMVAYVKDRPAIGTFFLTLAGVTAFAALTLYRLN